MPRFAANLTMMFTEHAFLDRFDAAAAAGFDAVECLFPYDHAPDAVAERLQRNKLTQALFNLPPGNWEAGERGLASLAGRFDDVRTGCETALPYVKATDVKRVHLVAGIAGSNDPAAIAAYRRSVIHTAEFFAPHGVDVVIEPINRRNIPGFFLSDFAAATSLIGELGLANLKLQFDIYHCQIIHGDVTTCLREMMPVIGHIQTASVPSRHEPNSEELNDTFLFGELDRLGYRGFVGCEYIPAGRTEDGLGWFAPYRPRAT